MAGAEAAKRQGDLRRALAWIERAGRFEPGNPLLLFERAALLLSLGDAAALDAFVALSADLDTGELWAGLATAALRAGQVQRAEFACARMLSEFALQPDWRAVCHAVAGSNWCALTSGPARAQLAHGGDPDGLAVLLDGRKLRPAAGRYRIPPGGTALSVSRAGLELLGSPIRLDRIRRIDGFIERRGRAIEGWAWHPGDPTRDPVIVIISVGQPRTVRLRRPVAWQVPGEPRGRPRRIAVPVSDGRVSIRDIGGLDLPGSPVATARGVSGRRPPADIPRRAPATIVAAGDVARANPAGDLLLLGPKVRLSAGALPQLRKAAYAAADIGSVAAMTVPAHLFDDLLTSPMAGLGRPIPAPPAAAAALYLRHDCRDAVPPRRALFAGGPGVDLDVLQRAHMAGWRHLVLPSVLASAMVAAPADPGHLALAARNRKLLQAAEPPPVALAARRRDLMASLWSRASGAAGAVLLISHGKGGGLDRVIEQRIGAARLKGLRPVLLRPGMASADGEHCCMVADDQPDPDLALGYRLPAEWDDLVRLLAGQRPQRIELHHRLGHHPQILSLADRLDLPFDIWVHDYAAFCPRIALVGASRRYCGEPLEAAVCTECVAQTGSRLEEAIGVAELRARSAGDLAGARQIFVPTPDVARRMRRQFASVPGLAARVVIQSWDTVPPPAGRRRFAGAAGQPAIVCVIGAIGVEKGLDVLLACGQDAARRHLNLRFTLVGFSTDDTALLGTGRVWVTGPYAERERDALIRAQQADFAFLPSIWPETWCFALSNAWEAGLPAVVFDLGAPAERIRAAGPAGGIILPSGLTAEAINDRLLAFATIR